MLWVLEKFVYSPTTSFQRIKAADNQVSTTYLAVILNLLAQVLPMLGINVGSAALNTTAQTIIAVATGVWVLVERYKRGDVTAFGSYKL